MLARMSPEDQREFLSKCGPEELLAFDAAFEAWASDGQLPPQKDGWRTWLMMAGRGFGKTRAGAEWVHRLAWSRPMRIALVAATIDEARAVMVEGVSGILSVARRQRHKVKWEPSLGRLTWPRGTVAQLFSGDNADGLRGPEHHAAWCDELAKWRQADAAWDNLQMGLRAGARPRALVTTTPRPIALLKRIMADARTVRTGGRTNDNVSLPRSFVDVMMDTYAGTRLGRQELDGELIADVEGALWPRELIERSRAEAPEQLDRIVVGVDPPAGAGEGCDACGIVRARVIACNGGELQLDIQFDDRFLFGRLRYFSGANCGAASVILAVSGDKVRVRDLPRAEVVAGDIVELREGCDKRFQTCVSRFANAVNFRGEPHLPGNDLLTRYPGA
jgi:phage terminase large subunit-like protein